MTAPINMEKTETRHLKPGMKAPQIVLPAVDGSIFDTASQQGRPWMLGFFRFAGCPFCNLRLHGLVKRFDQYGDNFNIVAVFDSPLDNLIAHTRRHDAPFPILADETNIAYRDYGIEHSLLGVAKGITMRIPTLVKATLMGFIPLKVKGRMTTMPADFLIDADGVICTAYYGKDEGDHLPFPDVKSFADKHRS